MLGMTRQEMFDKAVKGIREQRAFSLEDASYKYRPLCMYRGANGTKCTVGMLIPDELYTEELEDKTPGERLFRDIFDVSEEDSNFLNHMQAVLHDNLRRNPTELFGGYRYEWDEDKFEKAAREMAYKFNLKLDGKFPYV